MGSCNRGDDCKFEPTRYESFGPEIKCSCGGGCGEDKCKKDKCSNPIRVLSNNVLWNGCDLRYLNLKPGDDLENALQEIDKKMQNMEKKYLELIEAYNDISKRLEVYERSR